MNLRRQLVVHSGAAEKEGESKEDRGKYHYGHSWAMRFYKRHNLASRVCATKMRGIPADLEAKKATYIKIGAELIHKYNVPPALVINGDETAVLLVIRAKVTRNTVGAKRVRILGMGEDKAQIVTDSGDVLAYQMIFAGSTTLCHPKSLKLTDCLWTNTQSHWQSVETYLKLLGWTIVPYVAFIVPLGLSGLSSAFLSFHNNNPLEFRVPLSPQHLQEQSHQSPRTPSQPNDDPQPRLTFYPQRCQCLGLFEGKQHMPTLRAGGMYRHHSGVRCGC